MNELCNYFFNVVAKGLNKFVDVYWLEADSQLIRMSATSWVLHPTLIVLKQSNASEELKKRLKGNGKGILSF